MCVCARMCVYVFDRARFCHLRSWAVACWYDDEIEPVDVRVVYPLHILIVAGTLGKREWHAAACVKNTMEGSVPFLIINSSKNRFVRRIKIIHRSQCFGRCHPLFGLRNHGQTSFVSGFCRSTTPFLG